MMSTIDQVSLARTSNGRITSGIITNLHLLLNRANPPAYVTATQPDTQSKIDISYIFQNHILWADSRVYTEDRLQVMNFCDNRQIVS